MGAELFEFRGIFYFLVGSRQNNSSFWQKQHPVYFVQNVEQMRDNNSCFFLEMPFEDVFHDALSYLSIQRTESVIDEVYVWIRVDCARDWDPLFLATWKIDASLSDLGEVPCRQNFEIIL